MPDLLKYLIVDDDEFDRISIEAEADKFPFLQKMAVCSHPVEAAELIARYHPDIVFADIAMPDMNGLQLMKMLNSEWLIPVFVTSHPEFAVDSYEIQAFDYLLKPLSAERFATCALRLYDFCRLREKAFAFEREQESNYIIIKQGYEKCKLPLNDIVYIEAMKDYTRIHLPGKQYLVLATLNGMHAKLPKEKFVQVHRSYVVNIDKIEAVKGNKIYMHSGELSMGKLYKNALKDMF